MGLETYNYALLSLPPIIVELYNFEVQGPPPLSVGWTGLDHQGT